MESASNNFHVITSKHDCWPCTKPRHLPSLIALSRSFLGSTGGGKFGFTGFLSWPSMRVLNSFNLIRLLMIILAMLLLMMDIYGVGGPFKMSSGVGWRGGNIIRWWFGPRWHRRWTEPEIVRDYRRRGRWYRLMVRQRTVRAAAISTKQMRRKYAWKSGIYYLNFLKKYW